MEAAVRRRWWLLPVLAGAALLAPGQALADPISIVATLAPYIGGAAAAAVATVATFVATYGGYIYAAYSVYGGIQARREAKRAAALARRQYNDSLQDRMVTTLRADPPWRIVYGRAVVGGDIVAVLTSDKTGVTNSGGTYTKPDALKHLVIVLAAHQVHAIHEVMIDGIPVGPLDGDGWATSGEFGSQTQDVYQEREVAAGATVTFPAAPTVLAAGYNGPGDTGWISTTYSVAGNSVTNTDQVTATISVRYTQTLPRVRVEKFVGTDNQAASAYLQSVCPAEWTANDRLRGLAGVVVTLDLEEPRFQGGPPPLTFDVSGRLLYDPRTHTTAHSDNPALVIRDWLTAPFGLGVAAADVDDASVIAAANACDEIISLTVGNDTSNGARYTCNGSVTTDSAPEAVLEDLALCMAGTVTHTGGLWVVNAGVYTVPVLALTENIKAGPIEVVQAGAGYESLFNGVRGTMVERGRAVLSEIDPYSNAAYVAADGQELWVDRQFNWTDNRARARNLARIWTEQNREGLVIRYPAMLHAWPLVVGDRVTVTDAEHGWSAKVFRVTDWQWSLDSAVLLTLQEDGASIYDLADAATADSLPNTGLPDPFGAPPAVTGLAANSGGGQQLPLGNGTIVDRVLVSWAPISSAYVTQGGLVELRWRRLDADAIDAWRTVQAPGDATQEYLVGARAGDMIVIGATAINSLGVRGTETLLTHVVAARPPTTLADVDSAASTKLAGIQAGATRNLIWRQGSAPTVGVTDGDVWFDTSADNRQYARIGGAWVSVRDAGIAQAQGDAAQAIIDAANAQVTADSKVKTFAQASPPTATGVGDLWMDTDDGNRLYRWTGSAWAAQLMGTGAIAPGAATEVFGAFDAGPRTATNNAAPVNVVAAAACHIIVTVTVNAQCVNSTGSTKYRNAIVSVYGYGDSLGGGTTYDSRFISRNIANGETQRESYTASYTFTNIAAGADNTFSASVTGTTGATIDTEFTDIRVRVEVIYR
jgi:hypothetical protein